MRLALLAVAVAACNRLDEPCVAAPCPAPGPAFEITLTGSPAGTPLTTASFRVLPGGSAISCNQGSAANTCVLYGVAGTYQVEISAMFYETVQHTIVVPAKPVPRCACPSVETQRLTIALSPTS